MSPLLARSGRSWSNLNNTIVDNHFSNIYVQVPIYLGYKQVQAVYLDDELSGTLVVNNTIVSCDTGVLLGGGRNNTVSGNRFVNCSVGVDFDNRGDTWQKSYCQVGGVFEQELTALHYQVRASAAPRARELVPRTRRRATGTSLRSRLPRSGRHYARAPVRPGVQQPR